MKDYILWLIPLMTAYIIIVIAWKFGNTIIMGIINVVLSCGSIIIFKILINKWYMER